MQPQDWSRADKLRAADLLARYAAALEERANVTARKQEHMRNAKAAGVKPDRFLLGELNAAWRAAHQRAMALGDALALLGLPPSGRGGARGGTGMPIPARRRSRRQADESGADQGVSLAPDR